MLEVLSKPKLRPTTALALAATAITGATVFYGISQFGGIGQTQDVPEVAPLPRKISALGRLEPDGEAIHLAASSMLRDDRVVELLVAEGDVVEAGQIVAVLDSASRLQAQLEEAEEEVRVAQAQLAQVEAGAKTGEINAQAAQIDRLAAQWQGDEAAQVANIGRIQAQWEGERIAQAAQIDRIAAQWEGERIAQEATIGRIRAELKNADAEYDRYAQLYRDGAVSRSLFDSKQLDLETRRQELAEAEANLDRIDRTASEELAEAEANLDRINRTTSEQLAEAEANLDRINRTGVEEVNEAEATLDRIAEVRPVDVQVAQAGVDRAIAAAERVRADLELAYVTAPSSGQILKIHTYPGEQLSENGVVELGKTAQMLAIAEVYQTDIDEVRVGQPATVTSQAFSGELRGEVSQIGLQVEQQDVFSDTPGENLDRRVVEVKIRLNPEDSDRVSGLTNLQVQVAIEP
ncbi:MAG: HlyD family efflux transporter periplasmic adaptor subunit [Cyanobacteriota bacterium]|nr:HlyD family efflux transporter periplasmic adaptor subunit [Cyanobacteriota bacterium]